MISDRLESRTTEWLSAQSDVFKRAFAWLRALPADAPDGITELAGKDFYVHVQGYATKTSAACRRDAPWPQTHHQ